MILHLIFKTYPTVPGWGANIKETQKDIVLSMVNNHGMLNALLQDLEQYLKMAK